MSHELILLEFRRLAEAPQAISRFRRLVLDAALSGTLVPQLPSEGTATELLNEIRAERQRLTARRPLPTVARNAANDVPTEARSLPTSWCWSTLAEVGLISPRNASIDGADASFIPMQMIPAEYGVPSEHVVRPWGEIKRAYTHFAEGDVGLAKITPCFQNGKSTVFRDLTGGIGAGTTELHVVRPILVNANYLLVFLKSNRFIELGIPKMTGTAGQKRVPSEYFTQAPLPLPPLDEQHRIVAKVRELMALCDELETMQTEREARRDRLRLISLRNLTASDEPKDSARFFIRNSPRMITSPEHVAGVRQALLDLAVRGRLVAQDPTDESAAVSLTRIARKRDQLLADDFPNPTEAKTQRKKQSQQAVPASMPNLPCGWVWATLMQCSALVVDCRNKTVPYTSAGVTLLRTTNVRNGAIVLRDHRYVSEETHLRWSARYQPQPGDIIITREAPMGEVAKIPAGLRVCLGQRLMLARLVPNTLNADFLVYSLRDSALMERVQDKPIGALVEHLRVGGIETLLVPLPPLAEQHRIVAKVDELMAVCDELERSLSTEQTERGRLLEALLHDALEDRVPGTTSRAS